MVKYQILTWFKHNVYIVQKTVARVQHLGPNAMKGAGKSECDVKIQQTNLSSLLAWLMSAETLSPTLLCRFN